MSAFGGRSALNWPQNDVVCPDFLPSVTAKVSYFSVLRLAEGDPPREKNKVRHRPRGRASRAVRVVYGPYE